MRLGDDELLMQAMTLTYENLAEETAHHMAEELLLARAVIQAARGVPYSDGAYYGPLMGLIDAYDKGANADGS